MIKLTPPPRGTDKHGSGEWQAPRSYGKHRGEDVAAWPGSIVHSFTVGMVTKIGFLYSDDPSYRYVEVLTPLDFRVRYLYVEPCVGLGDHISVDQPIGAVQDIRKRYEGITPHVHLSVKDPSGKYINPKTYFGER